MAYTSINQMGFLLTGIATGTPEGYRATLIYLLVYAAMSIIFLLVFIHARRDDDRQSLLYLSDFRGLGQTN